MILYHIRRAFLVIACAIFANVLYLALMVFFLETATFPNANKTVYTTITGECYHLSGCSSLSRSKIKTTVEDAVKDGYRQCSNCDSPVYKGKSLHFNDTHYIVTVPACALFACIGTAEAMQLDYAFRWYPFHLAIAAFLSYGFDMLI